MTQESPAAGLRSILRSITNGPYSIKTWNLLCACAAGEAFLLYAILVAHTLRPVTEHLIGHYSNHPGAAARYQELFNWNGLIPTIMGSLFVVAAVWAALRITARSLARAPLKRLQIDLADPTSNVELNLGESAFSDFPDSSPSQEQTFTDSASAMPSQA